MAKKVVWTESAWIDLETVADFIARDSPYYAASFVREIRSHARSLSRMSARGRVVPEIDLDEYSKIAEAAEDALRKTAEQSFKTLTPGMPRPDAVMYCLGALETFAKMPRAEIQQIAFEIAAKGQSGLDTSDAAPKYQLKSLPGNFSGLNLVCLMYVAFQSIAPDTEIGFDLSKEYAAAQVLYDG